MGWPELGEQVRRARTLRYRTLADFARRTGLHPKTLGKLERGVQTGYAPGTLGAVEDALGWEPGDCMRIVGGGRPRVRQDEEWVRLKNLWPRMPVELRRAILRIAEDALDRE